MLAGPDFRNTHSMQWGINPPQKHHLLFFAKPAHSPLNLETVQASLFREFSPYIGFSWTPVPFLKGAHYDTVLMIFENFLVTNFCQSKKITYFVTRASTKVPYWY